MDVEEMPAEEARATKAKSEAKEAVAKETTRAQSEPKSFVGGKQDSTLEVATTHGGDA